MRALYLADTVTTATAEWYRSLAEWGLSPQDHIPYDHHRWRLHLELADLSDVEPLRSLSLEAPGRAEAHGLPINRSVSSSGTKDGPGS